MIARACDVPRDALLYRYCGQGGIYTDCFEVMLPGEADLPAFLNAFYTTWLFRLERAVLTVGLRRRVTDAHVRDLAQSHVDTFAVWKVEARSETQILLADRAGQTRSFLAVAPKNGGVTRLLFGSAVVPPNGALPPLVRATLPLHRFYSKALLRLTERKLRYRWGLDLGF